MFPFHKLHTSLLSRFDKTLPISFFMLKRKAVTMTYTNPNTGQYFFLWSKKKYIIVFQGNTFTHFINFIVKSLQKELNSTNLPLYCYPQSAGINVQSAQSESTPKKLTLYRTVIFQVYSVSKSDDVSAFCLFKPTSLLKVSKFQKQIFLFSFEPKKEHDYFLNKVNQSKT